jgi:cobaltochelatase CobN
MNPVPAVKRTLTQLLFVVLVAASLPTQAATLLGIVSDRAAPLAAEAARVHLATHPGDRIVLRTPAQFEAATEKQAARWLNDADGVLAVAVFSDPARRLTTLLPHLKPKTRFVAINGDGRLSALSRLFVNGAGADLKTFPAETLGQLTAEAIAPDALAAAQAHLGARAWLAARQTWQAGGENNMARLYAYMLDPKGGALPAPKPEPALRVRVVGDKGAQEWADDDAWKGNHLPAGPAIVVVDLANADSAPADALCAESRKQGLACVSVLSRWGAVSKEAMQRLPELIAPAKPAAIVVLQDFVVGAAEGREVVTATLNKLNVPVIKAIRLSERSALQWRLSPDGLPPDSVQYRVALPELQGAGEPIVIAAAGRPVIDKTTGLEVRRAETLPVEITRLVSRAVRWQKLSVIPNRDKHVAIVYYNHPPGRQNIGADNLDVPASLLEVLRAMKAAGYTTGELPATSAALLDRIMAVGVNLPEDREALRHLAGEVNGVTQADYARWFATLPPRTQGEMVQGPLGRLHAEVIEAEQAAQQDSRDKNASGTDAAQLRELGRHRVNTLIKEMHHLAEGANHPKRLEAMALLDQLHAGYDDCLSEHPHQRCEKFGALKDKITALGVEGLRGWGAPPGKVMVEGERLLVPGLTFGNIFIGPQPPRGWEVNEELLHANTSIPPPHQYLAFYHWIRDNFKADAVVHMGRHSTYEFLPGKAVGLTGDDYPSLIASDLPGIYPYIVDGVGEGIQAKRRGLAVIVDHLTPPLVSTPLYDKILELRQVVESYEAASSDTVRQRAAQTMREQVEALHLRTELEASMAGELEVRGIGFDQADNDLLAHEIGHYLTKLQERFMPHGLHVFGQPWTRESLDLMLDSMKRGGLDVVALEPKLADSPRQEMASLLNGLSGGFVPPGKGNDPLRSPEVLPTGRNFHAVDGDIMPTKLGYKLGAEMAAKALAKNPCRPTNPVRAEPVEASAHPSTGSGRTECLDGSEAVILWASDAVRDEGVMVAFSLALLGAEPVWNARGIVTNVHLLPTDKDRPQRRDVIITTSGLFRDLYPNLLNLIDRAGRMALAASAATLVEQRPELKDGLTAALAPLGKIEWGHEDPTGNRLAARWVERADVMHKQGQPYAEAGREAAWRIFGDAPGAYSTGVNRLTERSGAWRERDEIGKVYLNRMGHVYGMDGDGDAAHAAFGEALKGVTRSYHGRASNLYGLLDNNDAFDYLGGLSLGVETLTGRRPEAYIVQHSDASRSSVEPLASVLLGELRGRFLNPAWIKPLMNHGYSGARTMGQEFVENLWGWQVTRPDLIQSWAWDDVKDVYFDDSHKLGLPQFLAEGHNAHVKAHMLAIFMVAAQKGYWKTDDATLHKLGSELAQLVNKNGLPGSGHTSPTNPMWTWLKPHLDAADARALDITLARARGDGGTYASAVSGAPATDTTPATAKQSAAPGKTATSKPAPTAKPPAVPPSAAIKQRVYELLPESPVARGVIGIVALSLTILLGIGMLRGARGHS